MLKYVQLAKTDINVEFKNYLNFRSATFLAISCGCKQLNRTGRVDTAKIAKQLRKERHGSLQAIQHYFYFYLTFFQFAINNKMIRDDRDFSKFVREIKKAF